jgi:hypothetical protein
MDSIIGRPTHIHHCARGSFARLGAGPAFPSKSLRSRPREVKIPALSLQRTEGQGRGTRSSQVWVCEFQIQSKV